MREKSEELCTHCENGTPEICLLNPGGDCMKADYVHYKPKPAEREKPESEYERVIELLFDRVKKDFPQVMLAMEQVKYYALAEGARRERERMENGVDKAR